MFPTVILCFTAFATFQSAAENSFDIARTNRMFFLRSYLAGQLIYNLK